MAEENAKQEATTPATPVVKETPAAASAAPAQAGAAAPAAGQKKNKKINGLAYKELEKKIQEVGEKMKGLTSSYARQLLKQKEWLLQERSLKSKNNKT
ncbi:MAG: hypothetical protein V1727_06025 [Candidatus Omnitrophota bacterium]